MQKWRNTSAQGTQRPCVIFLPCYRNQQTLDGICQFAYEANWILDSQYFHSGQIPDRWHGDGIICTLSTPDDHTDILKFVRQHSHIPTVDMSRTAKTLNLPRVLQDNAQIGRMAAEHLISRGCRKLGFLWQFHNSFHDDRLYGFKQAAEAHGHTVTKIRIPDDYTKMQQEILWLTKHAEDSERPFGIMAAADYLIPWAIQACSHAKLHIPGDIAIIGVDNCREICELSSIAISSIDNNQLLHGYEAAKLLHKLMQGKRPPTDPILVPPGALHVRASSDIMATRHPHVATALHYIADHYLEPDLTPSKVSTQVSISERRLHDAFLKYVGRSMYQEITHRRVQRALRLVQETDTILWDIAEACGFKSPEVMSRLFTRTFGHAPSYYRFSKPGTRKQK